MEKKAIEYKLSAQKGELKQEKITNSEDAAKYARNFYFDDVLIYESAFIMMLNNSGKVFAWAKISQGGINSTLVDVKIVAKYAIDSLAASVIFIHNHPSGSRTPSIYDKRFTEDVNKALNLFQIKLLDSIILTEDSYYSFQDEGLL